MLIEIVSGERFLKSSRWSPGYFRLEKKSKMSNLAVLGDLCSERKETLDPQQYKNILFNYIGLENIEGHSAELVSFSPQYGINIKSRSKIFYLNDVLYGRLRPNLNKAYHVDKILKEGICTTEIIVLVPNKNKIVPEYLREILLSKIITEKVSSLIAGAALPRLHSKDLLSLRIPFVSLEKQKEISLWISRQRSKYTYHKMMCAKLPAWISENFAGTVSDQKYNLPCQFEHKPKSLMYDNKLPVHS